MPVAALALAGDVPPQNLEAEQAVLGAILLDNAALHDLPASFRAEDFYRTPHVVLFRAMQHLITNGKPCDLVTLCDYLRSQSVEGMKATQLEHVGGPAYLAGLSLDVPTTANVAHYAQIVSEKAARRNLMHAHAEALALTKDELVPLADLRSKIEALLLAADHGGNEVKRIREADAVEMLMRSAQAEKPEPPALRTGIASVDAILRINATDVVVVAAPSGGGKSVFLSQIARANGMGQRSKPVLVAALEMGAPEMATRRLMDVGSVDEADVRLPESPDKGQRLMNAADRIMAGSKVEYIHTHDLNTILREAVRMLRKTGLAALIIDYLQILEFPAAWGNNRDTQIGTATRMLKKFALDHRVPVVLASQLRRIDGRAPGLSDLRESGNIGNDANAVLILDIPGLTDGTEQQRNGDKTYTRLLIAKQRMGKSNCFVELHADFQHARFVEHVYERGVER